MTIEKNLKMEKSETSCELFVLGNENEVVNCPKLFKKQKLEPMLKKETNNTRTESRVNMAFSFSLNLGLIVFAIITKGISLLIQMT